MTTQPIPPTTTPPLRAPNTIGTVRPASDVSALPVPLNITASIRALIIGTLVVIALGIVSRIAAGIKTDFPFRDLIVPMFALGSEANIPTMFSSFLLGTAAFLAFVIALAKRQQRDRFQRLWMTVSGVFVYLSIDEVAQVHDRATMGVRKIVGDSAVLHYAWVLPYAVVVVAVIVLFVPFLRHLPRRTAGGMMLAGALYVLGAMGLEVIEGMLEFSGQFYSVAMPILVTLEESLEMGSVVLFIWVLLTYLRQHLSGVHLDLFVTGGRAP